MSITEFEELQKFLNDSEWFNVLKKIGKEENRQIVLVGGALRNFFLGHGFGTDFDFIVDKDVDVVAKKLARALLGSFFCLDSKRGFFRVVEKRKNFTWDFAPITYSDINSNLTERDFTINALGTEVYPQHNFYDPCEGFYDIKKSRIRPCSLEIFDRDPLRLLRAYRLKGKYNLNISDEALSLIHEKSHKILSVSKERIKSELFIILNLDKTSEIFEEMAESSLLFHLFPEIEDFKSTPCGMHHSFNLLKHSLETLRWVEWILNNIHLLFSEKASLLKNFFMEVIEYGLKRGDLLKFIAFLHDTGKPATHTKKENKDTFYGHDKTGGGINGKIAKRLSFSTRAQRIVKKVTEAHMRPLNLKNTENITENAVFKFFSHLQEEGSMVLILSIADISATKNILPLREIKEESGGITHKFLNYYWDFYRPEAFKNFITGKDVMEITGEKQGKEIGKHLKKIKLAYAKGLVRDKNDIIKLLSRLKNKSYPSIHMEEG